MGYTLVASMRNEGPFIVEWVTWYRALGFDDILVVTNDCTDHSPELLDALEAAGWVTHLRHDVPPGTPPCPPKLEAARRHDAVRRADWVFVCDVDEFLVVHRGQGRITDLVPEGEEGYLGMAINWNVFGTSGHTRWQDGLVHRQFLKCGGATDRSARWVKSIFRRVEVFSKMREHGPWLLRPDLAGEAWGRDGLVWVNSEGHELPNWRYDGSYPSRMYRDYITHRHAQINHYMIRSDESFGLKRGTLNAVAMKDRYTDEFYEKYNRNEFHDATALKRQNRFDRLHAKAMALPQVARLHHLCCADYVARLAAKAGGRTEDDPRYEHHLRLAGAF